MERLRRMHEEGGRSCTRKCRRDLASDVAGFAHARHDDARLAVQNGAYCRLELVVDALFEPRDRPSLKIKRFDGFFLYHARMQRHRIPRSD